ncbi:uncharacterized protein LOC117653796 [Thrips palmi]|uniref:Uncharacterized protein LOC117653796 n=1 Tax=Thrips palmi TaxID=161013 RepID=A0A6P9ABS2_THRPL|nr:uncharacterized protein LOC117653796 [Thrips palmi]
MEECPGQRDGSTIYYFDGHMYRKNRSTESSSYFRCATRGCMGRVIHKHRLGTIVAVSPHNHDADPHKHNLRRFLAAMQRRVNLETIPIHEIYLQEASRFPGIEEVMPYQSLQLQMEKRRRLHEINEMNQSTEMKQLHFLNLCDIEDMTKSIRAREAQDPLFLNASGGSIFFELKTKCLRLQPPYSVSSRIVINWLW